ncbi:MAG TPA: HAD family phosphatase [Saprospiraceae bacterium]|nr:MAG: HAD family hydrolase [Candidatus Parvibacillus calidus]MCC7148734.1 HAD family phosphatase [Saprospiraceae bacterium]HRN34532.1 HAD family phosphatase [Saprospiraceae bacterium]HRP83739.1 HAD family phosphatase [Saprospiraceae bacterium]
MIDTIVFDLGGVLIDWNPMYVYKDYFPSKEDEQYFFEKVATFEWNEEQDAGKPLIQATEERIRLFPEWEQPLRDFYGRWEEMLKGPIRDTVEIFRSLKETQAYRFYALSNWSAENFHVALDRFEFLHWFDGRLISGEEKMAKPNPAFFKLLETRYDVIPQNAVYIDDNFRNYKAAEALGFLAIHFISPEQLKGDLENYSIEI